MIIWKPEDTQEPDLDRDGEITTFKSILTDEKIAEMLRSLKTPDVKWFDLDFDDEESS